MNQPNEDNYWSRCLDIEKKYRLADEEAQKNTAGVLVLNGSTVLAIRGADLLGREGLRFPYLILETGQCPEKIAVRAAKEKTGLDVELDMDRNKPFIDNVSLGAALIHTYFAKVKGGRLLEAARGKGVLGWIDIYEVTQGSHGHYNAQALRHFFIHIPPPPYDCGWCRGQGCLDCTIMI